MRLLALSCLFATALASPPSRETTIRASLSSGRRLVQLPAGVVELNFELIVRDGTTVRGHPSGTTLFASRSFQGRALLVCGSNVRIERIVLDGNRGVLARPVPIAPYDRSFASFYGRNGILVQNAAGVALSEIHIRAVSNFAVLVSASRSVTLERIRIEDSGSLNANGRNNTTGGILLEEGTKDFVVRHCRIARVRGNGVWTHSRSVSPRNETGLISSNQFSEIGRDAIQVGHATRIRVEQNTGTRIGYPVPVVDVEGGGTPVGIDTAGNVDESIYYRNGFNELNGKCIDLDGFHDGEVRENTCINNEGADAYPFGNFGIAFNNTNPGMQSRNIRAIDNTIIGAKFGGIFLIGSGHTIQGNKLLRINQAGCNENGVKYGCLYYRDQPDMLQAGIYLAAKAERADLPDNNVISGNLITGHGMAERCILAAPGVDLKKQTIRENTCQNQ